MNKNALIIILAAAASLAGCANNSPVGLIDVNRVVSNWDVYQGYQQQLLNEEQAITQSRASNATKQSQAIALQKKYGAITDQLTKEVRDAAAKVAAQRNLKLVLTTEGVGYGGVDITKDVEKIMNITEKASPSPT